MIIHKITPSPIVVRKVFFCFWEKSANKQPKKHTKEQPKTEKNTKQKTSEIKHHFFKMVEKIPKQKIINLEEEHPKKTQFSKIFQKNTKKKTTIFQNA